MERAEVRSIITLPMDLYAYLLVTLLAVLGAVAILGCFRRASGLPPGPLPLPVIGNLHMLGKLPHRSLHKQAKKYGPIMSLYLGNVPAIVASSAEAAELFLKTHDREFAGRPKIEAVERIFYGAMGVAFSTYGPHWQSIRKLCISQLLSPSKVRLFAPMRREQLRRLVEGIKEAAAALEALDLTAAVEQLVGDVSFDMILGGSFKEKSALKANIHEALCLAAAFNVSDYVPFLRPFDLQGVTRRAKAIHANIDKALEEIIDEHERNAASDRAGDFVDLLLSTSNLLTKPENELRAPTDRTNIKATLLDIITAADESSSIAIDWVFSEIMRNPRVMARLQDELETVVGLDRMVEEADLPKLKYLEMVVKEALRLHPVGPLLLPHESMEDTVVNGYYIPKKSRIIVNVGAIGRDPKIWSGNAEEFIPERFINDGDVDLRGHDFRLIPFGSGRRACPGTHLAMINVRFVVGQLVHCFHWELPRGMLPEDLDMAEAYGMSCLRTNHLILKPTYRLLV